MAPVAAVLWRLSAASVIAAAVVGCTQRFDAPPPGSVGTPPSLSQGSQAVEIRLTETQAAELAVRVATVTETSAQLVHDIGGDVVPSPDAFSVVSAPISGRIVDVLAHEGEPVRAGQVVARIESLELSRLVADYLESGAQVDLDSTNVSRIRVLAADGVTPRARLLEAEANLARSRARLRAALARLSAAGVSGKALEALADSDRPLLSVVAPTSGVVDAHDIDLGSAVSAYDQMLTIVDNSEVMARGFATADQAGGIRPGDAVVVRAANASGEPVQASVTGVAPSVDPDLLAVVVYVRLRGTSFRPGQSVLMSVSTRSYRPEVLVPLSALTFDGDNAVVFVNLGPDVFEQRGVVVGEARADSIPVLAGVVPGEVIAVSNVYDLKALVRFEQYGEE